MHSNVSLIHTGIEINSITVNTFLVVRGRINQISIEECLDKGSKDLKHHY